MSTPNKPDSNMEGRLLLAFALMGVVLIVSNYLLPKPAETPAVPAPEMAATEQKKQPPTAPPPKAAAAKPAPAQTPAAQPVASVAGGKEETFAVETDLYRITFTNRGATARNWILKRYKDSRGEPLDLVSQEGLKKVRAPFSIRFHIGQSADAVNTALYKVTRGDDGLSVRFEYAQGEWSAVKTFAFRKDSYLTAVTSEVRYSGAPKPHLLYWRGGFGDATVIGAAASQMSLRFDLNEQALKTLAAGDARDAEGGYQAHRGRFSFAGITDAYFAAVALPDESLSDFEIHTLSDPVTSLVDAKEEPNAGVAVGGHGANRFTLFVGPKDRDLLRGIEPRLERLIDFGRLAFIAKPLFLAMNWLNDRYVRNYGWTIVLITIIINFLTLPLKITSLKSMKKMSALQPQIAAINEKYKGMSFKDPKKQNQQQEVMELYKKHGVNPLGGCVPMALQIPFFIAFYTVLQVAIELRDAHWLWVSDLSRPEDLPIRILPVAMVASQFFMQKMTPSTAADPSQQRIMLMMPLFLGFMFYGVSSGLVLYWLTSNLVGIAQQWFFNKLGAAPAAATATIVQKPASKKDKKR